MKTKTFSIIIIICIAGSVWLYKSQTTKDNEICFKDNCWQVEIADSAEEWEKGLMFRENLLEGNGMLFVFPKENIYSFWMKNTKIPLDIIWLDQNKKIVQIMESVLPCEQKSCPSYTPKEKVKYVLEINAGEALKIGLKEGEIMKFGK